MKKDDILKHRVDNNPERAAAIGVELHRARKTSNALRKTYDDSRDVQIKPAAGRAANLGKYHYPPKQR